MKVFLLLLFFPFALLSQADFKYTLKSIKQLNEDVVDVSINNKSDQVIYILRTEQNNHVKSSIYNKGISSKGSTILRLKLNPQKKGKVNETVNIYLSDREEPLTLNFSAKVVDVPRNSRQDCPSFKGKYEFNPLKGVYERQDAGDYQRVSLNIPNLLTTDSQAEEIVEIQVDSTLADNANITPSPPRPPRKKEKRNKPLISDRRSQPSLGQILFGKTEGAEKDSIEVVEPKTETELTEQVEKAPPKEEPKAADNTLGEEYRPNNIVFLLDASTSMKEQDKMALLKKAMVNLLEPLRQTDYLSIVTYSGEAKVLLPPTSANNKEELETLINSIEAEGSTQAVKGIKKALQVAKSNYLDEGNNQILLVSDGAFDIGERNKSLRSQIQREAEKGIIISVIGIKNENWTNKSLGEISELGQGRLLKIKKESDTNALLEEIKSQSLKN